MVSATEGCLICSLEDAPQEARVFRDDLWAAEVVPGYEVPGWFFLRARRHADLITGLDEQELSTFGHRARDLVAAVGAATGAPAVYLLKFGENYRHFHALITARMEDLPPQQRGGLIVQLLPDGVNRAEALALVPAVRAQFEELTRPDAAPVSS